MKRDPKGMHGTMTKSPRQNPETDSGTPPKPGHGLGHPAKTPLRVLVGTPTRSKSA